MINYHRLLNITILLGTLLLENGAEIYRVEESMQRVLMAYGVKHPDVFAVPNLIVLSIETEENKTLTKTKRIHTRSTNFDRVGVTNDYIRKICATTPPLSNVLSDIRKIHERPIFGLAVQLFGAAMVGFFFTLFFRGTCLDGCIAALAVTGAKFVCLQMERFHVNSFFITIVASTIHTTVAASFARIFPFVHADLIIMGTLMILVPGVAFTTAIRDIIAKDLLAGMIAGLEAILIASAIAIGNAMAYWGVYELWRLIG